MNVDVKMLMLKMTALSANSFKIITQGINQHRSDTAQKAKSQCLVKQQGSWVTVWSKT